jgi:signal transduction histidine kinase
MSRFESFLRFRVSLALKFMLVMFLLVAMTSLAFGWFIMGRATTLLHNQLQDHGNLVVRSYSFLIEEAMHQSDHALLQRTVEAIVKDEIVVQCAVVNASGQRLAYAAKKGFTANPQFVYRSARPILSKTGQFLGTLDLEFSMGNLAREMDDLRRDILLLAMGVIGIGIFLTLMFTRILLRPIGKLVGATERVGKGELAMTVDVHSQDEIGDLATAFNHMTLQLKESRDNLEKKVEERTHQLEEKIEELSQARMATLRMIENLESAKRELERANRELREMDETKLKFIGTTSHELKTPLTAIKSNIDFILSARKEQVPEDLKPYLLTIQRNTNRIQGAMDQMLDITRIKAGRLLLSPESIHLSEAVREYVSEVRPVDKNLSIHLHIPETLYVRADRNGLHDIFVNLLTNAFKFTLEGGEVSIAASQKDNYILHEVEDTGVGISEDQMGRIFDEFYQVEGGKYGGTGLGLAIAKVLVEEQGGEIWARSQVGKGSTFFFTLPVA